MTACGRWGSHLHHRRPGVNAPHPVDVWVAHVSSQPTRPKWAATAGAQHATVANVDGRAAWRDWLGAAGCALRDSRLRESILLEWVTATPHCGIGATPPGGGLPKRISHPPMGLWRGWVGVALLALVTYAVDKDPYVVLGVGRSASDKEIKRAHQRLAMKWHPDKNQGDKKAQDKFVEAQHAYELLSDAEKRRHYDLTGFADPQEV